MNPLVVIKSINKDKDLTHAQARWLINCVLHADNKSGKVHYAPGLVAKELGISPTNVSAWINDPNNQIHRYVTVIKVNARKNDLFISSSDENFSLRESSRDENFSSSDENFSSSDEKFSSRDENPSTSTTSSLPSSDNDKDSKEEPGGKDDTSLLLYKYFELKYREVVGRTFYPSFAQDTYENVKDQYREMLKTLPLARTQEVVRHYVRNYPNPTPSKLMRDWQEVIEQLEEQHEMHLV